MKYRMQIVIIVVTLLMASLQQQAQVLDVSVINTGHNTIQIIGVPTAPGFTTSPNNSWASMNLTWRIPKTAVTSPTPTVVPPAPTPEVTGESTAFTGVEPRNTFDGQTNLSMFDLTSIGQPDDGYWYFQITGTVETVQNMPAGTPVVLYSFQLPVAWACAACVEILTTDVAGPLYSTTSFIDNAGLGADVLRLAQNNAPLPVHFISFEAHRNQDQVQLNWRVSDEENLHGYFVERSGDGINYTQIGFVAPKPAAAFNDYAFTDVAPLDNMNYYRIREEDIDGRSVNSVVRVIKMQESGFIVSLYPVPVRDVLMLKLNTNNNGPAYIRITDMLGRTVLQRRIQLNAGDNIQKIPVHGFVNGMYFIEVAGANLQWAGKFVKE